MKYIYKYIIIIACTPAYVYCVSIPDTVNLNEVSVISPKSITFSNGSNVKKIDPLKIKISQTEKIADLIKRRVIKGLIWISLKIEQWSWKVE